jgi:uncharacterized protein (DUF885 family)
MRSYWKYGILLLLTLLGFWLVRLLFLRPFNIDHFFDRTFLLYSLERPEYLSTVRVLDQYGFTSHRKHLDDISVQAYDRAQRFLQQTENTLKSYDRAQLEGRQALSYDVFQWYLRSLLETNGRWRFHDYPVNPMHGVQNSFPRFMQDVHVVTSKDEARDYVSRLYAVREKFEQLIAGLTIRQEKGIVPPDFILDRVLNETKTFISAPLHDNMLYTSFARKLEEAKIKDEDREIYLKGAEEALRDAVYPAYAKLIAFLEEQRKQATSDAGVWKWPDGDAYYRFILAQHTSLDLDPEEVHQLGLKEVARLQNELRLMLQKQGYNTQKDLGSLFNTLSAEPRFYYSDDESGREQILRDYQSIIDEAARSLDSYFAAMPSVPVKVERVPAFMEAGAPAGSYAGPSMDGKRPGVFYANLGEIKNTVKFGMRTLAYHEGIPGHHLQIAISQNLKDLPLFQREVNFTAYVEGWALYAERLAFEAGLEKDPFDSIGRLRAEIYRAARLVVDTGIHAKRWTREQAIDYLHREGGVAQPHAVREVERYVVMPGQACAYMIGMLKFLELRTKAQTTLGPRFDLKSFHQVILENGAMPLSLLEQRVDQWMTTLR